MRFYEYKEYKKLSQEKNHELNEHRDDFKKKPGSRNLKRANTSYDSKKNRHSKKETTRMISAAVSKAFTDRETEAKSDVQYNGKTQSYIMRLLGENKSNVGATNKVPTNATTVSLISIPKRSKTQGK